MEQLNDKAYTIRLDAEVRKKSNLFQVGHKPWNKGLSWAEQGMSEETRIARAEHLKKYQFKKGDVHIGGSFQRPVIQIDKYGDRIHWYVSSAEASRKTKIDARNIRKVCSGERLRAGGYGWRWDENFL